ncbi:lipid-A-disaccharide synthase [Methylosinus trichosporium]|uniref:lipid-A-disaccharide synthase n=1 Tax=Methylosinus TaxID=425 RepID=UPI003B84A2F1
MDLEPSGSLFFLIAGEPSGDLLGALLMRALRAAEPSARFCGVGGEAMAEEGLASLFAMSDIAVMGLAPVLRRLPLLIQRIEETARAVLAAAPDVLVLIDAPDFTHRVAQRVRRARPQLPIIDYVAPTVWAWRPWRARAMRTHIDEALAVLPFEPAAFRRLGGPPCAYVGHPLVDRLAELTPSAEEETRREASPPLLLVLPGSRRAEVARLMPVFGEALAILARRFSFEVVLPVVPQVEADIHAALASWPIRPRLATQAEKYTEFRRARAALAVSGVVTLELALAGTPMVVAYKVAAVEALLKFLVRVDSFALPNLVLGERIAPEFLQEQATPQALAAALAPLLGGGAEREAQRRGLERARALVLSAGPSPSAAAAARVLAHLRVAPR